MVFGFFKQCLCPLPCSQILLDLSGIAVQISLALVWPVWRTSFCSTFGCQWGRGATALLVSQVFYLVASVFTRCMRDPRHVRKQREANEAPPKKEEEEHDEEDDKKDAE